MKDSVYTNGLIEPAVNISGVNEDGDSILSIAISLKRIADHMDRFREVLDKIEAEAEKERTGK